MRLYRVLDQLVTCRYKRANQLQCAALIAHVSVIGAIIVALAAILLRHWSKDTLLVEILWRRI